MTDETDQKVTRKAACPVCFPDGKKTPSKWFRVPSFDPEGKLSFYYVCPCCNHSTKPQ